MRQPIFVVSAENPQSSMHKGYARLLSPSSGRWITTRYTDEALKFHYYHEAKKVYDQITFQHANNRFWVHKIERIDLCETILEDIDNLHDM